jgi:hypothetical protein
VIHLRKSKPVVIAAGLLWTIIAFVYAGLGRSHDLSAALQQVFLEYAELLLFLIVAMTYVNALEERRVYVLRAWLARVGFSYRALFWATGSLAFILSPVADNLTTALVMGAVVIALGTDAPRFVAVGLRQYRRGGECWRRVQSVRRHHHLDGVAEGDGCVPRVLLLVSSLGRELRCAGAADALCCPAWSAGIPRRNNPTEDRGAAHHGAIRRHDHDGGWRPYFSICRRCSA